MSRRPDERGSERAVERLLEQAAPRPLPPAADAEEIRRAVYVEWEAVTRRRLWQRRAGYAVAGCVVLWFGRGSVPSAPPAPVARVELVHGIIDTEAGTRLAVGSTLVSRDAVSTRSGQVALRLASGGSLRLASRTEVVLTSADAAELVSGVLYFDSENRRAGAEFSVTTPRGSVRDVGTQFVVRVDAESAGIDVGVRHGRVRLTLQQSSDTAGEGERLVATADAAAIRREAMPKFGGDWEWVEQLAPPFDIDGRTVGEFLGWLARQTGRKVVFGSPQAERVARETRLTGSIDLAPLQKLSAVLALTDLTYTLEEDRVVIETR